MPVAGCVQWVNTVGVRPRQKTHRLVGATRVFFIFHLAPNLLCE